MYRKTHDEALHQGVYHSDCRCRSEISVRTGDHFPRCPKCQRDVAWLFTRSVYDQSKPRPAAAKDISEPKSRRHGRAAP